MRWSYDHQDLDEPRFPDGTIVRRPVVVVRASAAGPDYVGVVDSGSPITVASPAFLSEAGVGPATEPIMEVPFGFGRGSRAVQVFTIDLELVAPIGGEDDVHRWTLPVGLVADWRLSFAVLFGQLGWFDTFRTTIDRATTVVELPDIG